MKWFDRLFISSEEEQKSRDLTAQLVALEQERLASGLDSPEKAQARIKLIQDSAFQSEQDLSPSTGFVQGLKEGADNIRTAVGSTIDGAVGLTWRMIPWQVWAILVAGLLLYLAPLFLPAITRRLSR